MKPTPELAQALTNLRASHDFDVVIDFLKAQREEARDLCENKPADDPMLPRAQGRAAFVREFLELSVNAPSDLEKFKQLNKR